MSYNLKILGSGNDALLAEDLIKQCADNEQINIFDTAVVFENAGPCIIKDCKAVVLPLNSEGITVRQGIIKITYSLFDNNADLTVINMQKHEENNSFELMTTGDMSRIFISKDSRYSTLSILVCGAYLLANNMNLSDITGKINVAVK